MTWDIVLQSFTAALAGIGGWFLYDLVSEFKTFKKDTRMDIISLKQERTDFKNSVRAAEISMSARMNELQAIHNSFSLTVNDSLLKLKSETEKLSDTLKETDTKSDKLDHTLSKAFQLFRHFNKEIKSLKVEMEKITIFKTGK